MKKTKLPVILALALVLVFLFSFAGTAENVQPGITIGDVSLRIDNEGDLGLRFVSDVQLPLPDGARITKQGTLIVPLYVNGYEEFTLETNGPITVLKAENKIYSKKDNYYQFAAVLEDIPEYHLASPICARSFITYTVGDEESTVYSEIEIYDAYSLAEAQVAADSRYQDLVIDAYNTYITNANAAEADATLTVTVPVADDGKVYLYADDAKAYLKSGTTGDASALVNHGNYRTNEVAKGIDITWTDTDEDAENVKSYTVMYYPKDDFSKVKYAWSTADDCKVSLYNLYKGTTYDVKIIANDGNGTTRVVGTTFQTADLGPRVIYLNGPHNARDLGGYASTLGGTVKQGMLYRSGKFNYDEKDTVDASISDFGQYLVRTDLGLKTELDLREAYTKSLDCTNYFSVRMIDYDLADEDLQAALRYIFGVLADNNNYPILFHCQGGADRTGTLAYLINALLGVSEPDLAHDYEFTSYSWYGTRLCDSDNWKLIDNTLDEQEGSTLQERVECYLENVCEIPPEQIESVKTIMLTDYSASETE